MDFNVKNSGCYSQWTSGNYKLCYNEIKEKVVPSKTKNTTINMVKEEKNIKQKIIDVISLILGLIPFITAIVVGVCKQIFNIQNNTMDYLFYNGPMLFLTYMGNLAGIVFVLMLIGIEPETKEFSNSKVISECEVKDSYNYYDDDDHEMFAGF